MISIIFFGTHDFAATVLNKIIASREYDIKAVVTQPDRPAGREQETAVPAVKTLAAAHGLTVLQPASLKEYDLKSQPYDLNIVCQYGRIIPRHILETPRRGTINIHTSLLPKYRGASPMQTALLNGDAETGVTIMLMDELLDHGPIITQEKISILPSETYPELSVRLAPLAADLLITTIPRFLADELSPTAQNEQEATVCNILARDDGKIDWTSTAEKIFNQYRGLTPWPGIWTIWNGVRLKLLKIQITNHQLPPGRIRAEDEHIYIGTGQDAIEALELQLEGKKAMSAADFINGYQRINGAELEY